MKRFLLHQRVRINDRSHPLYKRMGTVVELRHSDVAGYVEMDGDLPVQAQKFPVGVVKSKPRQVLLWPSQCGPVRQVAVR